MNKEELEPIEMDKAWNAFENPVELYRLWKEEENLLAAQFLANKYHWGDEANGIFINPVKAREIYEEIGESYEEWEKDPEEDDPHSVEYIIEGSEVELNALKNLFDKLNSKFGTPDLFDGVYIPLEVFMFALVKSRYYQGNVLSLETNHTNKMRLKAELDKPHVLFYALKNAFPNLKIAREVQAK